MRNSSLIAGALIALLPLAAAPLALADSDTARGSGTATCPLYGSAGQAQMSRMQALHSAIAAAKTPEERQKLMQEGFQAMQGGMAMLQGCPGGTGNSAQGGWMMERRMQMMQSMIPMMMQMMGGTIGMGYGMGPGAGAMPGPGGMMPR